MRSELVNTVPGPRRTRAAGAAAVEEALAGGAEVPVVLLMRDAGAEATLAAEHARRRGARVLPTTRSELRRLADAAEPVEILALVGPDPRVPFGAAVRRDGAAWLLAGVRFPGNVGFALRTAEVSGACAVAVAPPLAGAAKRAALRASMGADRFFPVAWTTVDEALAAARAANRRVIAIEDSEGARAPWRTDLTGDVLFVLGGEREGLAASVVAACDAVVRLPMRGFIPAYNVHAAMAAVVAERLRQEEAGAP